jgi:hypothetical protein
MEMSLYMMPVQDALMITVNIAGKDNVYRPAQVMIARSNAGRKNLYRRMAKSPTHHPA